MIDFIVTTGDDMKDVCNIRMLRSVKCNTDHKLVRRIFKLQARRNVHLVRANIPKRINVASLSQSGICQQFTDALSNVNTRTRTYATGVDILGMNEWKQKLV